MSLPTIILVAPQMGENIGFVMRTMANFGCADLRLVSPRDPWPNPKAITVASGSAPLVRITTHATLTDATQDLTTLFAVTARARDIKKTWVTLGKEDLGPHWTGRVGLVFGPEKTGLSNEDVSLCHRALTIPTNPEFPSLNLSHAVAVCVSHLPQTTKKEDEMGTPFPGAPKETVDVFLSFLETALAEKGFFAPPEKAEKMRHNLRDLFLRTPLTKDDLHTLFGAVKALGRSVDK